MNNNILDELCLPGFYKDAAGDVCIIIGTRRISCTEKDNMLSCSVDSIATDGTFSVNVARAVLTDINDVKGWLLSQVRIATLLV